MNRRIAVVASALLLALIVGWTASAQAPQGIVVTPPSPQIQASISVDKAVYQPGERIFIHYNVSVDAFVYLIDIDAQGRVTQIFPNVFSQNNFVQAGNHTLPDSPAYSFVVTPPAGTELVQILATLQPINLGVQGFPGGFPNLGSDPAQFQARAQAAIQGIVPTGEVATAFTSFQIGGAPSNNPPVANFSASPQSPNVGQNVLFDASASFDPDGFITSYEWDFNGDGQVDARGVRATHVYFQPGQRRVTLTVTDNGGRSGSSTQPIQVGRRAQPPVANFSFNPNSPNPGQNVRFDASASFDPDGFITSYQWDLNGDGFPDANGVRVNRAFSSPGQKRVTLTVTDNAGLSSTTTQFLTVNRPAPPSQPSFPGFFVNSAGTNTIRIRVQGDPSWSFQQRAFRINLETDGRFTSVNQQGNGAAAVQGISPVPNRSTLSLRGFVSNGSITYTIRVSQDASRVKFDLRLDIDGDGQLERRRNFVFLGNSLVNPPSNPFVISFNQGHMAFDANLRVCLVLVDRPGIHFTICFRFNL